jgi:addiction module RelB/DinJ family antitoxin
MGTKKSVTKKVQISIDKELANEAESIFEDIGLNQETALTVFYKKVVAEGGLPFDLKQTPEQQRSCRLHEALKGIPVQKLENRGQVETWFRDGTQDY